MSKEIIIDNRCGGIVKQVRMQMNCTQDELGKKIGVDQPTMCRIERRQQMLHKLAKTVGVSVYQLTGQEPICYAALW